MSGPVNAVYNYHKYATSSSKIDIEEFISIHSKKQQEFLRCKSQNILFYGGRRAGKTLAVSSMVAILDQTLPKWSSIVICSSTVDKVKSLYWSNLIRLSRNLNLEWVFKEGSTQIETKRRTIIFHGLRDLHSASIPLGFSVSACIVEEGHTVRDDILKYYLNQTMRPCFMEFPKVYKIILALNPPMGRLEYLHSIYENPEWKKIQITSRDNPHPSIQSNFDAHLLKEAKIMGFETVEEALDSPTFQRTILGMWVYENNRLVINIDKIKTFSGKPPGSIGDLVTVIGVDIGGGWAKDAICVLQYSRYNDKVYLVEEWEKDTRDETLEELAKKINSLSEKYAYRGIYPAISIDTGALGNRLVAEMRRRYNSPAMISAKKRDKMDYLMLMRTEAHKGRLLFRKEGSLLVREFPQIFFDETFTELDERNSLHSDLLDACLYSYRLIKNYFPEERRREMTPNERIIDEYMNDKSDDNVSNTDYYPYSQNNFLKEQ